ncbi:enoyl-CoA hydratase/isomerase family protein [Nocardiopsis oceani]
MNHTTPHPDVSGPAVLAEDRGHVRILTLNRPGRRNALDLDDRGAFLAALEEADADPGVRALVLTGAPPVFSAGGDISSMSPDPEVSRVRLDLVNRIARQMLTAGTPVVAAVEGGAYGLGLSLSCACDTVVAGRGADFAASFARIGLVADTGLFHSLPMRVGAARARQLLMNARAVSAEEAEGIGLVDEVVDDGAALERAVAVAGRLARWSAPMVAATRRILAQPDQSLDALLAAEAEAQTELLAGPEFAEGRAAFLERRRADFVNP